MLTPFPQRHVLILLLALPLDAFKTCCTAVSMDGEWDYIIRST